MGEVIDLKSAPLSENHEFVSDCCRFREEIMDEAAVRKKWKFDAAIWEKLGSDDALIAAVEAEQVRRVRTGQRKRERAQKLVVAAPDVVAKIMMDDTANARHRIDAAASLDKFAANPADSTPVTSDRFIITINLGADHVERYDKSISINAEDVAPNDIEPAPVRTGYQPITDSQTVCDSDPAHKTIKTITDNQSAYDIALAALMERE